MIHSSNRFEINGIDVSLTLDTIKLKDNFWNFTREFTMFVTNKNVTERDKRGKIKLKAFQMILIIHKKGILVLIDQNLEF